MKSNIIAKKALNESSGFSFCMQKCSSMLIIAAALLFSMNIYSQVGINTNGAAPNNSAMLDVSSTSSGILINRMSTVQMNAIVTPAEGLMIFNVDNSCFYTYVNGAWKSMSCPTPCTVPSAPAATAATALNSGSFLANWNVSSGATSYLLDVSTVNTFATCLPAYNNLNVGNVTSFTIAGLTTSTPYYYRLRAVTGLCKSSNSNIITAVP
jgi:hypothetical protein